MLTADQMDEPLEGKPYTVRQAILELFGEKCDEYDPGCPLCQLHEDLERLEAAAND